VRFVAGGLRGVARASREEAAAKWDLLAEMLEVGIKG
jgi:gamma-tubulin complex component 5